MKNLTYVSFALFLIVLVAAGCEKTQLNTITSDYKLTASKTTLRIGDFDTLTIAGAENQTVKWTGHNNITDSIIQQQGNKLIIKWYTRGTYQISASINGGAPITIPITVTFYYPTYTTLPITNENVIVTPHYYKSPTSDSTYFTLSAQFTKVFPCGNSFIEASSSQTNNNFIINFTDIKQPNGIDCSIVNTPIIYKLFYFYNKPAMPYHFGTTYPLTIITGSKTYTGVITLNPTYMDIVWNYDTGVTMSSKHITL
ncbi:MAG: hypothetical protein JWQ34_1528 [Mucilaginibacter sp.]|uniref:hypothetical protein n=1 Tax=Mucilaginibacter sp. TaxID=1882438 RepID=UPI00261C8D6C|nr:hypothetical protein [Mucilaginibacter sp.]MDB5003303.1 hypothetical protein [Mucilaginibacter sp.]